MDTVDKIINDLTSHEINKVQAKERLENLKITFVQGNTKDALKAAVNALYFSDSSDYSGSLYSVVRALLVINEDAEININALFNTLNPEK